MTDAVKIQCPVADCGKKYTRTGLAFHMVQAHPDVVDAAIDGVAKLEEQTRLIAEKDAEILKLTDAASLAESTPSSIADFPGEEQAAYFTEFLKSLSDEEKAKLSEETGFGIPASNSTGAPLASKATTTGVPPASKATDTPAPLAEGDKPHRIVLTFHGKPLAVLGEKVDEKHYTYGKVEINYRVSPQKERKDLYSVEQFKSEYITDWDKGFSPDALEELKKRIIKYTRDDPGLDKSVRNSALQVHVHAWRSFEVWHTDENGNRGLVKEKPTDELLDTVFLIPALS